MTQQAWGDLKTISIHPPLAGRDKRFDFSSQIGSEISIHPPLAGRDATAAVRLAVGPHFNPPAPCGAGRSRRNTQSLRRTFQSTRPLRGGTKCPQALDVVRLISIHPPLAGRDTDALKASALRSAFQSTRPLRGGTRLLCCKQKPTSISIHPPLAGRDSDGQTDLSRPQYFNPPAPCGAGLWEAVASRSFRDFNPPAPCGAGRRSTTSSA